MTQLVLRAGAVALVLLCFIDVVVAQESEPPTTPPVAGAIPEDATPKNTLDPAVVPLIVPALLPSEIIAPEILLSLKETEAVALSEGWKDKYTPAILGRNGQVIYHFGESVAAIVTAPNNVTDIELEAGEIIVTNGIFIGDSLNWEISPKAQTIGNEIVSHIVVKPFLCEFRNDNDGADQSPCLLFFGADPDNPKKRLSGQYAKESFKSLQTGRLIEHFVSGSTARTAGSLCGVNRKLPPLSFGVCG